ncbi:MAG: hypothetical protein ABIR98_02990, partial [Usitatibacter sp.]
QGGTIAIVPEGGTFYAGVPMTFQITGGRPPYFLTSSEPLLLPVPAQISSNSFTTVPSNPGVINVGIAAGDLPVRSVVVTVRDTTGEATRTTGVQIAQNFLTGYGVSFSPVSCPGGQSSAASPVAQACRGGTTAVQIQAVFNGNLVGNRAFRFEVLRGNFSLRNPATGQVSNSITVNSDHTGTAIGIIEVAANTGAGLGVLRVVDVATGVYADTVFVISGQSTSQLLTATPNTFTFTGALTTTCGTGSADFIVFDGTPPYTAVSSFPSIVVTPSSSPTNPGRFTVTATDPNTCISNGTIVITDALGGRVTVTVTTEPGSIAPPTPVALQVGPTALTLGCGQSGSVTVIGGTGGFSATSTSASVTALASGNSVTITRANTGTSPTSVGIGLTDGRTVATVTVTVPATCP